MNPREQEIWKRCYSGLKLQGVWCKYANEYALAIQFKGQFNYNSPVYHYTLYGGKEYEHVRDTDGWEDPTHHTPSEEDNDPRFPKPVNYMGGLRIKTSVLFGKFFTRLRQGLESLSPVEPLPPRVMTLLQKTFRIIPDELILMICTNLMICELEWLEKLLLREELEELVQKK